MESNSTRPRTEEEPIHESPKLKAIKEYRSLNILPPNFDDFLGISSLKKDKIPSRITKHFFKMKRNNKSKIAIKSFLF